MLISTEPAVQALGQAPPSLRNPGRLSCRALSDLKYSDGCVADSAVIPPPIVTPTTVELVTCTHGLN
jgi:hypothetical protein